MLGRDCCAAGAAPGAARGAGAGAGPRAEPPAAVPGRADPRADAIGDDNSAILFLPVSGTRSRRRAILGAHAMIAEAVRGYKRSATRGLLKKSPKCLCKCVGKAPQRVLRSDSLAEVTARSLSKCHFEFTPPLHRSVGCRKNHAGAQSRELVSPWYYFLHTNAQLFNTWTLNNCLSYGGRAVSRRSTTTARPSTSSTAVHTRRHHSSSSGSLGPTQLSL